MAFRIEGLVGHSITFGFWKDFFRFGAWTNHFYDILVALVSSREPQNNLSLKTEPYKRAYIVALLQAKFYPPGKLRHRSTQDNFYPSCTAAGVLRQL